MAKKGSIAPKQGVTIVYRTSKGEAQEDVEQPLKILVPREFTGSLDGRPMGQREPVNVDNDNDNDNINLTTSNLPAVEGDQDLDVQLRVESMKDFGPESIADQVPEKKRLLELRDALRALMGPLANAPEFRKKIQDLVNEDATRQRLLAADTKAKDET